MNIASNRKVVIGAGAAGAGAFGLLFFFYRGLFTYFLIAAIVIGLVWALGHYGMKWSRKQKQRQFDAGVAAKEGIDDRKREWDNWTEELARQGIDRYELPFYLLVGEPQSGKSVLLQNSDLHFPFGQTRLSGIGGTRGCDWWFTEEAVILDLAGRLFTHEGGASDEAEWEAFLELLTDFRPTCPANGVMLVIPSDSLATDSRDEAMRKASQIQTALLTLTNKLQARIPIFLILTKADRIFGFAETVHRLSVEQRQQMCGWSRPAEDYAAAFDIVEAREAFTDLVGRARLLRETMLSSIRLPEGIPEVDRMYAFPDELAALSPNLEIYLKRVFSESAIVDRLYFRGFYLTSGLQTGAPIAKVCSELMGSVGEADKRDLEGLFSKHHAYFIRDLIRRRVFSERGLVQPTQARIIRNKKRAWTGYGLAATIAVVSVVASLYHAFSNYSETDLGKFNDAIGRSVKVANTNSPLLNDQFAALESTWQASTEVEERGLESTLGSRRDSFQELYRTLSDKRMVPELHRMAELAAQTQLKALVISEPARPAHNTDEFLSLVESTQRLVAGFEPGDSVETVQTLRLLEDEISDRAERIMANRRTLEPAPQRSMPELSNSLVSKPLQQAIIHIESLWNRTLAGGDPLQIPGAGGYVVSWKATLDSYADLAKFELEELSPEGAERLLASTAAYYAAYTYSVSQGSTHEFVADEKQWELDQSTLDAALDSIEAARASFKLVVNPDSPRATWRTLEELRKFEAEVVFPGKDTGEARIALIPTSELRQVQIVSLGAVCSPHFLVPDLGSTQELQLPESIANALRLYASDANSATRKTLYLKMLALQADYLRRNPNWKTLAANLTEKSGLQDPATPEVGLVPALNHLTALRKVLTESVPSEQQRHFAKWIEGIDSRIQAALSESEESVAKWDQNAPVDSDLLHALNMARGIDSDIKAAATARLSNYLSWTDDKLLTEWMHAEADGYSPELTPALLGSLSSYLGTIRDALDGFSPETHTTWLAGEVEPLLLKHADIHEERLQFALDESYSDLIEGLTLKDTAERINERIKGLTALNAWQSELSTEFSVLDPKELLESLKEIAKHDALAQAHSRLTTFTMRARRVTTPNSGKTFKDLKAYANKLKLSVYTADGEALAKYLHEQASVVSDSPHTGVETYLLGLHSILRDVAIAHLRELYVTDLKGLQGGHGNLFEALFATTLEPGNANKANMARQLRLLFKPNGEFDSLQVKYKLDGASPLDFRPSGTDAVNPDWWACDEFLRGVRLFMQKGDTKIKFEDYEASIWLKPGSRASDVWGQTWLFTSFTGTDEGQSVGLLDDTIGPITWKFDDKQPDLTVRWSSSLAKAQENDVGVTGGFCIAPMVLCWLSPSNDGVKAAGAREWPVEFETSEGVQVDFTLVFDYPLPHRPKNPMQP